MIFSKKQIRQIAVPEIGLAGQQKLQSSRVLVIGAGGLGTPACMSLAAAGVGTIGLIDDDVIEESNLGRQIYFTQNDIGQSKVDVLSRAVSHFHPECKIASYKTRLTAVNAESLLKGYDVVINGSDNFATRYAINSAAVSLRIPWVDAAVIQLTGQVTCFLPNFGCYACLFPDTQDEAINCSTEGILSPLCGMFGSWSVACALKLLLNLFPKENGFHRQFFYSYDLKSGCFQSFEWKKNPDCPVCQTSSATAHEKPKEEGKDSARQSLFITDLDELKSLLTNYQRCVFLDLSSLQNQQTAYPDPTSKHLVLKADLKDFLSSDILEEPQFFSKNEELLSRYEAIFCFCEAGIKSGIAAEVLRSEGCNAYGLQNIEFSRIASFLL